MLNAAGGSAAIASSATVRIDALGGGKESEEGDAEPRSPRRLPRSTRAASAESAPVRGQRLATIIQGTPISILSVDRVIVATAAGC